MIFGIFRKIAVRSRFLDRVDDLRPFGLQALELLGEDFQPLRKHRHLFNCRHFLNLHCQKPSRQRPAPEPPARSPDCRDQRTLDE